MGYGQNAISITRDELYEQVWAAPMVKVAAGYGVSDVALGKLCKRLNVPKPYPGYWAKVASGKRARQTPLPKAKEGDRTVGSLSVRATPSIPKSLNPLHNAQIAFEQANPILCVGTTSTHPLARDVFAAFAKARAGKDGFLASNWKSAPSIRISEQTRERALAILNALFEAFVVRGFDLSRASAFKVFTPAGAVEFTLQESVLKVSREPTASEARREADRLEWHERFYGDYAFKPTRYYDQVPSGKLQLRITTDSLTNDWRTWSDSIGRPLQSQLNSFVVGLVKFAENQQIEVDKRNEERLREIERQRQAEERWRLKEQEEARKRQLWNEIENWEKGIRVLRYAIAYERVHGFDEPRSEWMRAYAAELSPLAFERNRK